MTFLTDIEIAKKNTMKPITEVAEKLGIQSDSLDMYGKYKAKLDIDELERLKDQPNGKLILVTAITPTTAGEGKTTMSVGLADALNKQGEKVVVALREPSLGPVFGMKGGAAGGGYAQVVPMEDINLHFTGDFHAIGAANNLLAALIDNHIFHGNLLDIDSRRITWKRVVDMNDRQLRHIVDGLNGRTNGVPREDGYDITVASEIMAILCLADGLEDLKTRIKRVVIGYSRTGKQVTAGELKAEGAMTALLKDAIRPNIVQTLEHTPAIIHGGPFANIAHGCNSVIATRTALKYADYVVTEAGFGADLGAEKFIDIKCRNANLKPDAVVLVATIRALKLHGGVKKQQLSEENNEAVEAGLPNMLKHISNMRDVFGLPLVVSINKFPTDTQAEIDIVLKACQEINVPAVLSDVWSKGGEGGLEMADVVKKLVNEENNFRFAYESEDTIEEKLHKLVTKVYGGDGVEYSAEAKKEMKVLTENGYGHLPLCVAKTQYSFSDNKNLLCSPEGFTLTIKNLKVSAGAGFIVALTGAIMTMPGLPKVPASENIDVDEAGEITGLF
ncbi:Formate-tetrahydrofolate ligase [Carnobacterium iners]|uniref:Formate--tetrahydrofolate ligase n=1 Tax=Carnobacterium iners TaxID=1073423 RepID=A0A1X7MYR3_9LACT|nr:formate--tetrahydrofolate ligase [Carnobacterium iners]SEK19500.1 Formate-tetrahydrofolate ligase [Carnobacterium iners]SMH30029.1 Formate-tetrahydrofolate ligase [Carnobacterium iners]